MLETAFAVHTLHHNTRHLYVCNRCIARNMNGHAAAPASPMLDVVSPSFRWTNKKGKRKCNQDIWLQWSARFFEGKTIDRVGLCAARCSAPASCIRNLCYSRIAWKIVGQMKIGNLHFSIPKKFSVLLWMCIVQSYLYKVALPSTSNHLLQR